MLLIFATPTETLLSEINDMKLTQKQVAVSYAIALRDPNVVDWKTVNHAIMQRWSHSGLVRVKEMAWKIHERESA